MTQLLNQIQDARRDLSRAVWVNGACQSIATLLSCGFVFGAIDWSVHVNDHGLRALFLVVSLALTGWVTWRSLIRPLMANPSDVEIAQEMERSHPDLRDRIASTVQFLKSNKNPDAGSPGLQQLEIDRTLKSTESRSLNALVNRAVPRRSAWWLSSLIGLLAVAFVLSPQIARTAMTRFALPLANQPWPRMTVLQFVAADGTRLPADRKNPLQHLQGESAEFFVKNLRGAVPDDAVVEFEIKGVRKRFVRSLRPTTITVGEERVEVGVVNIRLNRGPVFFRARGGDDDGTIWRSMEILPPPQSRPTIHLIPPAYTGEDPFDLPQGTPHYEALAGTNVEIKATVSRPIVSAAISVNNDSESLTQDASGNLFANFSLATPGLLTWRFDLTDADGFTNTRDPVFQFQVIEDQLPDVFINEPAADLQITSSATVPLKVVARDDLGIADVRIQYKIGLSEEAALQTIELKTDSERPEQADLNYDWNLADLNLELGTQITYYAEAADDYDLGEPHISRSVPRTLLVVSAAEKESEIASRQSDIMSELERVTEIQTGARDKTRELQLQLQEAGELRDTDVDLLKRVAGEQRRIDSRLYDPSDGLKARTEQLLDELDANQIEGGETRDRLSRVATELNRLESDVSPEISRNVTQAQKLIDTESGRTDTRQTDQDSKTKPDKAQPSDKKNGAKPDASDGSKNSSKDIPANKKTFVAKTPETALARASTKQQELLNTLNNALDDLSSWRQRHNVLGDIDELISGQQDINKETSRLARQTLTKDLSDLTRQQRADLARNAERQRTQARELNEMQRTLESVADDLSGSLADSVQEVLRKLKSSGLQPEMESIAGDIAKNRLGGALERQKNAAEQLEDLRNTLNNQSVDDTETLVKKLSETQDALEKLARDQDELLKKIEKAEASANPDADELETLKKQQQELAKRAEDLTEQLRRNQAPRARAAANRAMNQMNDAGDNIQSQDLQTAQQNAENALDDLDDAIRETEAQRKSAERQLAEEQLTKLVDLLPAFVTRQQNLIEETNRLEQIRQETGRLKRSQTRTLLDLAESQQNLAQETSELAPGSADENIVSFAITSVARRMTAAAARLKSRKTDKQTTGLQSRAVSRLEQLLKVLTEKSEPQQQPDDAGDEQNPEPPDETDSQPASDQIPFLAQLRLLRSLQVELNQRSDELKQQAQLSADDELELVSMADEQGRLASLVENLAAALAGQNADGGNPDEAGPDGGNVDSGNVDPDSADEEQP